jgi:hypothetical protein
MLNSVSGTDSLITVGAVIDIPITPTTTMIKPAINIGL